MRPKVVENTGSRPLSHSQATNRRISSWVGDDQRIPAVACFLLIAEIATLVFVLVVQSVAVRCWCGRTVETSLVRVFSPLTFFFNIVHSGLMRLWTLLRLPTATPLQQVSTCSSSVV
jgi:hypothetical protein